MRFRIAAFLAVLTGLALAAPTPSEAGLLTLRLTQAAPADTLTITDRIGAVGDMNDSNPLENGVAFFGSVGDFTVSSSVTGQSNNPGTTLNGNINTRTLQIRNDSAATRTLTLELSQTDFTMPGGATTPMRIRSAFTGSYINATVGDSVSFVGAADPDNGLFSYAVPTATQSGMATVTSPLVNSFVISPIDPAGVFTRNGDYSLSSIITVTLSAGAQVSLEGQVTAIAVPEPGTLAMAMLAMPLAGLGYLRHRRRSQA